MAKRSSHERFLGGLKRTAETELGLWRWDNAAGWKLERMCDAATAQQWLARFKADSPGTNFMLSPKKPQHISPTGDTKIVTRKGQFVEERDPRAALKQRAAIALGWSLADVNSLSLSALRENLRGRAPALVEEIDELIRSGEVIRGPRMVPAGKAGVASKLLFDTPTGAPSVEDYARIDREHAARQARPKSLDDRMVPGARVKLSGKFLKNTGQQRGGEGSKSWTVLGVSGDYVIVDEEAGSLFSAEELAADPSLKWRRIGKSNLVLVGVPSHRND